MPNWMSCIEQTLRTCIERQPIATLPRTQPRTYGSHALLILTTGFVMSCFVSFSNRYVILLHHAVAVSECCIFVWCVRHANEMLLKVADLSAHLAEYKEASDLFEQVSRSKQKHTAYCFRYSFVVFYCDSGERESSRARSSPGVSHAIHHCSYPELDRA